MQKKFGAVRITRGEDVSQFGHDVARQVWFGGNVLTEIPFACFPASAMPIAANVVFQLAEQRRARKVWSGANNSTGTRFASRLSNVTQTAVVGACSEERGSRHLDEQLMVRDLGVELAHVRVGMIEHHGGFEFVVAVLIHEHIDIV